MAGTVPDHGAAPPDLVTSGDGSTATALADSIVQTALEGARKFLGMDVAFIGEFVGGARVFRYVDSCLDSCPVQPGAGDPLADTYCQRVVDGRLPQVIHDASALPEAATLPVTAALPVGGHISVPIVLKGGRVYGTLCGFSTGPVPTLGEQHLGALRMLAELLAHTLGDQSLARDERARATAEILDVIADARFTTVFQPVVDLGTGHPVGFEALTRFPSGRPDEWFTRAAATGLTVPLELATLRAALRHVFELPADAYVAVNLSATAMCSEEFAAAAPDLPLSRLVLELTEQTEVSSYEELRARTRWLRALGARIAVDDAGSGYAGLQRILALSPDILKLDLQLIRGIDGDPARQSLALAMTGFAERTGAALVAEGIETAAEMHTLLSLGVRHGQGYFLGRPAPVGAVAAVGSVLPDRWTGAGEQHRSPREVSRRLPG